MRSKMISANRVNHADTEFDADFETVVGGARTFMIGSYIELDKMEHDCHTGPEDGCAICEKYAHEAWMAQA